VHDCSKPKKTGFEPNQNLNFGFKKSSGIPVFGISVSNVLNTIGLKKLSKTISLHLLIVFWNFSFFILSLFIVNKNRKIYIFDKISWHWKIIYHWAKIYEAIFSSTSSTWTFLSRQAPEQVRKDTTRFFLNIKLYVMAFKTLIVVSKTGFDDVWFVWKLKIKKCQKLTKIYLKDYLESQSFEADFKLLSFLGLDIFLTLTTFKVVKIYQTNVFEKSIKFYEQWKKFWFIAKKGHSKIYFVFGLYALVFTSYHFDIGLYCSTHLEGFWLLFECKEEIDSKLSLLRVDFPKGSTKWRFWKVTSLDRPLFTTICA
jgi:hypothetical protein